MRHLKEATMAALGGLVGTMARFLAGRVSILAACGSFPLGTFISNLLGCFLIGIFYGCVSRTGRLSGTTGVFLITGLCGGLTTFSAFSAEMVALMESGLTVTLLIYMGASLVIGISMVALGIALVPSGKGQESRAVEPLLPKES